MSISFDEKTHTFSDEHGVIPHVSQILQAEGFKGCVYYDEYAMRRGQFFHKMTEYEDRGCLDVKTLHNEMKFLRQQYLQFKEDFGITGIAAIEAICFSPELRAAGILDRVIKTKNDVWIIDYKLSSSKQAWHKLQTAGYGMMYAPDKKVRRACVYFGLDMAMAKVVEHKDYDDAFAFESAVRTFHWKQKNNLYPEELEVISLYD